MSALGRLTPLLAASVVAACPAIASPAAASAARRHHRAAPPVTLEWVGDIALSTQRGLPPGGIARALAPVAHVLHDAQITAGNLEGTLSTGGTSKCAVLGPADCYAFQAPPSTAWGLRALGFGVVNQANNHSMDFGASGRAQTVAALRGAGLAWTGFPGQITVRRAGRVRVAFLGFAPYLYDGDLLNIAAAQRLVRRARRRAQLVVVVIHAGAEGPQYLHTPYGEQYYLGEDRGNARRFAHAVIDAGASVVFGSGPHVIRGIERYRGRLIAYSLGDFVGYHTLADGGVLSDSGILRVSLDRRGRLLSGRWFSVVLRGGLPRFDRSNASARLVGALSRQDFPGSHFRMRVNGALTP